MALTTENTFDLSGSTGVTYLQPIIGSDQIRNSGGIVNIAGPVIVKNITVIPASGRWQDVSTSGVVLAVNHATSGQFAQLSGQELFRYDGAAHSGLANANHVFVPPVLPNIDFLARSGVVTLNSGTHVYDIIVTYIGRRA